MEKELLQIRSAYVRVSHEKQDERSLHSQSKEIREHAKKEGYIVPDKRVSTKE